MCIELNALAQYDSRVLPHMLTNYITRTTISDLKKLLIITNQLIDTLLEPVINELNQMIENISYLNISKILKIIHSSLKDCYDIINNKILTKSKTLKGAGQLLLSHLFTLFLHLNQLDILKFNNERIRLHIPRLNQVIRKILSLKVSEDGAEYVYSKPNMVYKFLCKLLNDSIDLNITNDKQEQSIEQVFGIPRSVIHILDGTTKNQILNHYLLQKLKISATTLQLITFKNTDNLIDDCLHIFPFDQRLSTLYNIKLNPYHHQKSYSRIFHIISEKFY